MPTEIEELVEFLHHGNTQIRQIACENLVGLSSDPSIFKSPQLVPVKDLKLLVRDYAPIAKNALTILINISHDAEILKYLVEDDAFVEVLLKKITDPKEPSANEVAMLLSNLAKSDHLARLITLQRTLPDKTISTSPYALDQLFDCFVKGADGSLNPKANYDYLSYLLADMSRHQSGRDHFLSIREYDGVVPISKLTVFTEHTSHVRREGVASTIKNAAFEVDKHHLFLHDEAGSGTGEDTGANLLPYILLPIAGSEEYADDETANMLPDLQLLPPDKARESDPKILATHLETLLLLTTTRSGRERLRDVQVYPIIRECHANVQDADVKEVCDRLVQVLMRDEAEDDDEGNDDGNKQNRIQEVDDDTTIEEVF
ncbi:hypothetical protein PV10_07441 [Exophiala mesophila]|uniref:Protein HGH1 homolog n=1 Tax=Exophiala mesophila TaxID=212818 RepID=A0A0D1WM85_EXOME|nr:uncharacterized protein PV10_07441 [Exophiala mesophila]KIV90100.1 hypothetical protein PV10_07441 [Exophiala mesophila]